MNRSTKAAAILTGTACVALVGWQGPAPFDASDAAVADFVHVADVAGDVVDVSTVELATAYLVGTWVADFGTLQSPMFETLPPDQMAVMRTALEAAVYRLNVHADGTFDAFNTDPATGVSYDERGTWYVLNPGVLSFEWHNVENFDSHEPPDITPDMEQVQVLSQDALIMSTVENGIPLSMRFDRVVAE